MFEPRHPSLKVVHNEYKQCQIVQSYENCLHTLQMGKAQLPMSYAQWKQILTSLPTELTVFYMYVQREARE